MVLVGVRVNFGGALEVDSEYIDVMECCRKRGNYQMFKKNT